MTEIETEKINSVLLDQMSINKFTYKQAKVLTSLQQRTMMEQKNINNKCYQITFNHNFTTDVLITNFQIVLNDEKMFKDLFDIFGTQANSISNRGSYHSMNNLKIQKNQSIINLQAYSFSQSIKLIINLKKDFNLYCQELLNLKKQKIKSIQQENISKVISHIISQIKIYGFSFQNNPPATQLTKLLNISQFFKKNNFQQEQAQTDVLLALCLINARRFIQASQLLRKSSNYFVKKYISSKSHLESTKYQRSWITKQYDDQNFQQNLNLSRNYSTGKMLEGSKYLFKAAKIQLLLAQNITHPSLINQKLEAYNRSNAYFNGNPNPQQIQLSIDVEEILFQIGPNLLVFLMKVLYDKAQILRITALKSIQFMYEAVGCSLSSMIPQILKTIVITYPSNQQQQINNNIYCHQVNMNYQNQLQQKVQIASKNKTLIDSYHHLLETFIGLLNLMNKKYLRNIFKEIVVPSITNNSIKNQLKLYLLRFSQKIISLCGSDLQITSGFISFIISLSEKKFSLGVSSKYTIHNISFFSQRIIEVIKNKIFPRIDNQNLSSFCVYLNENLVYFCENQIISENQSFFNLLLDFVLIIYQRKHKTKIVCPIQSVIYFLNMSISQQTLPFQKLLQVTIVLLKYMKQKNETSQINHEIISRIMSKSKLANLNIKQLRILQELLKTCEQCQIQWLQQFLHCIPHSTFDQIYGVFNILFKKCIKKINKELLKKIINTFLDQYTVKGKAHQSSKKQMIQQVLINNVIQINSFIQICLTKNYQPKLIDYESKKKRIKQHIIDTKLYKIHYQLFIQKNELFILFLNKLKQNSKQFYSLMTIQLIKQIQISIKKLFDSKNSKIKSKALKIIYYIIQIFSENINKITKMDLYFTKSIINLLKSFMIIKIQSKIHYQTILNIQLIFNKILKSQCKHNQSTSTQQSNFQFIDGNLQKLNDLQLSTQNIQLFLFQLRFKQFLKIYPILLNLLNSPWENIRQIIIQVIVNFFSNGILSFSINLQNKTIQLLKHLLSTFLQSSDHIQRLGACKIIGCLLGLSKQYKSKQQMKQIFSKTSKFIKPFINQIYHLKYDWNQLVSKMAKIILQISLTNQQQQALHKKITTWKRTQQLMQNSYCSFSLNQQYNFEKNQNNQFSINNFDNLETLLKQTSRFQEYNKIQEQSYQTIQIDQQLENQIAFFKSQIFKGQNLKSSFLGDKQSYIQRQQENYYQPNQDKADSHQDDKEISNDQQPLEFEDLGIIDIDDQQWGQQENQVKITQKLALKKIYKLSPNIGNSSKHQRIRSKRYFSHDFQPNDKIIVDQLQGKINHQTKQKIDKQKDRRYQKRNQYKQFQQIKQNKQSKRKPFSSLKQSQLKQQITKQINQSQSFKMLDMKNYFNKNFEQKLLSKDQKSEQFIQQKDQKIMNLNQHSQKSISSIKKLKKVTKKRKSSVLK